MSWLDVPIGSVAAATGDDSKNSTMHGHNQVPPPAKNRRYEDDFNNSVNSPDAVNYTSLSPNPAPRSPTPRRYSDPDSTPPRSLSRSQSLRTPIDSPPFGKTPSLSPSPPPPCSPSPPPPASPLGVTPVPVPPPPPPPAEADAAAAEDNYMADDSYDVEEHATIYEQHHKLPNAFDQNDAQKIKDINTSFTHMPVPEPDEAVFPSIHIKRRLSIGSDTGSDLSHSTSNKNITSNNNNYIGKNDRGGIVPPTPPKPPPPQPHQMPYQTSSPQKKHVSQTRLYDEAVAKRERQEEQQRRMREEAELKRRLQLEQEKVAAAASGADGGDEPKQKHAGTRLYDEAVKQRERKEKKMREKEAKEQQTRLEQLTKADASAADVVDGGYDGGEDDMADGGVNGRKFRKKSNKSIKYRNKVTDLRSFSVHDLMQYRTARKRKDTKNIFRDVGPEDIVRYWINLLAHRTPSSKAHVDNCGDTFSSVVNNSAEQSHYGRPSSAAGASDSLPSLAAMKRNSASDSLNSMNGSGGSGVFSNNPAVLSSFTQGLDRLDADLRHNRTRMDIAQSDLRNQTESLREAALNDGHTLALLQSLLYEEKVNSQYNTKETAANGSLPPIGGGGGTAASGTLPGKKKNSSADENDDIWMSMLTSNAGQSVHYSHVLMEDEQNGRMQRSTLSLQPLKRKRDTQYREQLCISPPPPHVMKMDSVSRKDSVMGKFNVMVTNAKKKRLALWSKLQTICLHHDRLRKLRRIEAEIRLRRKQEEAKIEKAKFLESKITMARNKKEAALLIKQAQLAMHGGNPNANITLNTKRPSLINSTDAAAASQSIIGGQVRRTSVVLSPLQKGAGGFVAGDRRKSTKVKNQPSLPQIAKRHGSIAPLVPVPPAGKKRNSNGAAPRPMSQGNNGITPNSEYFNMKNAHQKEQDLLQKQKQRDDRELDAAATKIQSMHRRKSSMKAAEQKRKSSMQDDDLEQEARRQEEALEHDAAIKLQCLERRRQSMKVAENKRKEKHRKSLENDPAADGAATKIQAVHRGRQTRRSMQSEVEARTQQQAATKIQSMHRRRQSQKDADARRQSRAQELEKMHDEELQNSAAAKIQGLHRARKTRHDMKKEIDDRTQKKAATKIQSLHRRRMSKKEMDARRQSRAEELQQMHHDEQQNAAASKIQSLHRARQTRKSMQPEVEARTQKKAATKIQSMHRRRQSQKDADARRQSRAQELEKMHDDELQNAAAAKIQGLHRARQTRKSMQPEMEARTQKQAATKIQSMHRRRQSKKDADARRQSRAQELEKMHDEELQNAAATKIQAMQRARQTRKTVRPMEKA